MAEYDYDLIVIGAGSGGVRASRVAAGLGARVAIIESRDLGGTCVNVGCVPKKLFVYGSHFAEEFSTAAGYGWHVDAVNFYWPELRDNKTREIQRLNGIYENLLTTAGVDLVRGHGEILDPHRVAVNDQQLTGRYILIATGGWPFVPEFEGAEHAITSNEAFYLDGLPERIAIVGGGYISVEFAGIFHGLGVETHLIYRGPLFLRGFDQDVREHLAEELRRKGIHLHFDTDVTRIKPAPADAYELQFVSGDSLQVGKVMYATGRRPCTGGLGLENTAVQCNERGQIQTNSDFQTHEPSIHAIGDVTGGKELTPIAIAEGRALANRLFGTPETLDYDDIPTTIFCQPAIGTVGLTEEEARHTYSRIRVYETRFRHMKHTLGGSREQTYMKVIVNDTDDRVVGCHMVGDEAGEIIQGIAIAIKAGATKRHFDETVAIHPTAAEEFVTLNTLARK